MSPPITGTVRDSRNFPTLAEWEVHIESGHSVSIVTDGCPVCTWRRTSDDAIVQACQSVARQLRAL